MSSVVCEEEDEMYNGGNQVRFLYSGSFRAPRYKTHRLLLANENSLHVINQAVIIQVIYFEG